MPYFLRGELGETEYADYQKTFHPRHVRKTDDAPRETLESVVASLLSVSDRQTSVHLRQAARLIRAYRGDGLSCTAEHIADLVAKRMPQFRILAFNGVHAEYGLPEVVRHVKLRRSLKVFTHAGMYDAGAVRKVLVGAGIVLLAVALASAADLLPLPKDSVALKVVLVALTSALAAVLVNQVKIGLDIQAVGALGRRIDDETADPNEIGSSPAVTRAIEHMSREFIGLAKPICVIVDDFARIDAFSQAVLLHAMQTNSSPAVGLVLWVVIEQRQASRLGLELLVDPSARSRFVGGSLERYWLDPLTSEERKAVLLANQLSGDRADDEVLVKDLVRGANAAEVDQLRAILLTLSQSEQGATGLWSSTVFQLVASNTESPGFELSVQEYVSFFSEKPGEGKRRLFTNWLSAYLGVPELLKDRALEVMRTLRLRLEPRLIVPSSPDAPLHIRPIAKRAIQEWPASQFPPETIELFWFLAWHRKRPSDASTALLQKLARHASRARITEPLLASPDGLALANETIVALWQVADRCLHATLIDDAVTTAQALLANVRWLISTQRGADTITDQGWGHLTRVCWQIYLASGVEDFLLRLLSLLTEAKSIQTGLELAGAHDEVAPYLRVMNAPVDDVAPMAEALRRLLSRDAQLASRLRAQMQFRTLEAVVTCARFSSEDIVALSGLPTPAELAGSVDAAALGEMCDNIYKHAERTRGFTVLDHVVLRGALTHAVRVRDLHAARDIVPAFALAPTGARRDSSDVVSPFSLLERAFLLQTAAVCLDQLLRLVTALRPTRRPSYQLGADAADRRFRTDIVPGELARDLEDVFKPVAAEYNWSQIPVLHNQPLPPTFLARIDDLYLQATLAWEEIGLRHLRDRTLMDRAAFLLEFTSADAKVPGSFGRIIQALGPALQAQGVQGALYHLELAEFFRPVAELSAVYVQTAVTRLLASNAGSDLALLFCMFLNHLPTVKGSDALGAANRVIRMLEQSEFLDRFAERFGATLELPALVNHLFSIGSLFKDASLQDRTFTTAEELLASPHLVAEVREELAIVRDVYQLTRSSPPTSDEAVRLALESFSTRRAHWLYPRVMMHLLDGCNTPELLQASFAVLEDGDPQRFYASPAILLALRLARITHTGDDKAARTRAAIILQQHVQPRVADWSLELAIETYLLLIHLDPDSADQYRQHHAQYVQLLFTRDQAGEVTRMLQSGHYLGVFRTYWDHLRVYQLPAAVLDEDWFEAVAQLLRTGARQPALERCLERMNSQPPPLITRSQNQVRVVLDFVLMGDVLAMSIGRATPEIDLARDMLNQAALKDLRTFLDVIAVSETVPKVLREFMQDHRRFVAGEIAKARRSAA